MSKVNLENMDSLILKKINTKIEDITKLNTEDKSSLVNAINEILAKQKISEAVGTPLKATDTWDEMVVKIQAIEDKLRTNIKSKDVNTDFVLDLNGLADKVAEINTGVQIPEYSRANGVWVNTGKSFIAGSSINVDGVASTKDKIYMVFTTAGTSNQMYEYDIQTAEFTEKLAAITKLANIALSATETSVFMIGGMGSICELHVYDILTNTNTKKVSPSNIWKGASVVSFDDNNVYCLGGIDSSTSYKTPHVQHYDKSTNTWTNKTACSVNIYPNTCVKIDDNTIGSIQSQFGYLYNRTTDSWSTTSQHSDKNLTMDFYNVTVIDGKIMLLYAGNTITPCIKTYHKDNDSWTTKPYSVYKEGRNVTIDANVVALVYKSMERIVVDQYLEI